MSLDHDTNMRLHATRRGPVTVTEGDRHVIDGLLVTWRPDTRRPGRRRGTKYAATVILPTGHTRTYPLNRYTVEPLR